MLEIAGGMLLALLAIVFLPQLVGTALYGLALVAFLTAAWVMYYALTHMSLQDFVLWGAMVVFLFLTFYIAGYRDRKNFKAEQVRMKELEKRAAEQKSQTFLATSLEQRVNREKRQGKATYTDR